MPANSEPIAILCLGYVPEFYDKPLLEMENWIHGKPLDALVFENSWANKKAT
jgi:5,6-dimethylbenzimidazole synthase